MSICKYNVQKCIIPENSFYAYKFLYLLKNDNKKIFVKY